MKKKICLLTALLLLMSGLFCACDGKPLSKEAKSPYEIYSLAAEKQAALDSARMQANVDFTIEMAGEIVPMSMTMDIKTASGNAMELDTVTSMVVDGAEQKVPMKIILVDNVFYFDMSEPYGLTIKIPFDGEFEEIMDSVAGGFEFDLTEADFASANFSEENGGYIITVPISGEALGPMVDSLVGNLFSSVGVPSSYSDLIIDDSEYIIGVDENGMLKTTEVTINLTMSLNDEDLKMSMRMVLDISDMGGSYAIAAPADADSYLDGESLGLKASDFI